MLATNTRDASASSDFVSFEQYCRLFFVFVRKLRKIEAEKKQNIHGKQKFFIFLLAFNLERGKWLGLDKHQKIIYGVKYCSIYAVKFLKQDLFTGKFVFLKPIDFIIYIAQHTVQYTHNIRRYRLDDW